MCLHEVLGRSLERDESASNDISARIDAIISTARLSCVCVGKGKVLWTEEHKADHLVLLLSGVLRITKHFISGGGAKEKKGSGSPIDSLRLRSSYELPLSPALPNAYPFFRENKTCRSLSPRVSFGLCSYRLLIFILLGPLFCVKQRNQQKTEVLLYFRSCVLRHPSSG